MKVIKTVKLFIGGEFPRTESGRSYSFNKVGTEEQYARLCQASRKDFRNSVENSKKAQPAWAARTAYNRSQILYRMAEMTEGKRVEFVDLFKNALGKSETEANLMVDDAIDTFVYYSGFCDKYQQVMGAVNPVAGPFHNFTTPEATGVVTLIDADEFNFARLIDSISAIITGGNSVVALLGKGCPAVLAPLAEVFKTSDLPGGVINLLTGDLDEIKGFIGNHMEVRAISFQNEREDVYFEMKADAIDNMKRMIPRRNKERSLDLILDFVEAKTVWHPIGQ
ncbi:MAG: acyl-CoA reductase-like NAD-dependent aldehyde dehydrogenase [Bacteriovoracaceae bacterium]|jgi:acyl-CoA reductase-like NAD-dependent aldehyde dehydrogenase